MNELSHRFPSASQLSAPLQEAMAMQAIEANPLSDEDIAMFAMFEREGWSHERRRAHIISQIAAPDPK